MPWLEEEKDFSQVYPRKYWKQVC